MDNSGNDLIQPNGTVDGFRSIPLSDRRSIATKNLQTLLIYDEHNVILGGSYMVDLFWNGVVWHYNNTTNFKKENATMTKELDTGVCDGAYLDRDTVVIAEDSGTLEVLQLLKDNDNEYDKFESVHSACQHDDSILSVSKFCNSRNVVTGGLDCCLKVWDVEDLIAIYSYPYAHTEPITSTDVKPLSNYIFLSTALDCELLLWDIRRAKPSHCIHKRNGCALSAVAWNTLSDHLIALGGCDGSITLIDIRKGEVPIHESIECTRSVHKLLFNPQRKEQLACCSDDSLVKVFDCNKDLLLIYEDDNHTDFVRGIDWCKDDLFSCSWDGTVVKHELSSDYATSDTE